jgi:hypothetical protein
MSKFWILAILGGVVLIAIGVAFRDSLRKALFTTVNRGKVSLDHTGNRTNDIPSRRGELPVDLR